MRERGFVDAHVHIAGAGWQGCVLDAEVNAVRDAGMRPDAGTGRVRSRSPLLVTSCWALYKSGGYGSRFGIAVVNDVSIKAEILRLKNAGADIIKTMASGMVSLKDPGTITPGGFDRHELYTIVQEAASAGLKVMAHANGEYAITAAAEAGVLSIEHGFFMTERALEQLARHGVFWVPTTGALARAADAAASPEARRFVARLVRQQVGMLAAAHSLGVQLAVGTDCVLPDPRYRDAYEAELNYFRESGIPEEGVLKTACEAGARLLELEL